VLFQADHRHFQRLFLAGLIGESWAASLDLVLYQCIAGKAHILKMSKIILANRYYSEVLGKWN
jgi:hypothetical protein